MAIETKTIQIRQGNKADLLTTELLPGEQVIALDTGEVGIKSAGGDIIWYATTAGKNKAIPYSDKGSPGGVAQLTAAPIAANSIVKVGTSTGVLTAALFNDFATGVQSGYDSASNSNYVKFPDGTALCYGRKIGTTDVNGYASTALPAGLFASAPFAFSARVAVASQAGLNVPAIATQATVISFWYNGHANTAIDVYWLAIGRWK